MIAIHGAGSFGHMDAKECGLGEKERKTMMSSEVESVRRRMRENARERPKVER